MSIMSALLDRINEALRTDVAPALELAPSELEATAFENGIVSVRLGPACHSCSGSITALIASIESELRTRVPEVEIVEVVV
jgi:Fe-S cluster biogenesis protein NfuA